MGISLEFKIPPRRLRCGVGFRCLQVGPELRPALLQPREAGALREAWRLPQLQEPDLGNFMGLESLRLSQLLL